MAEPVRRLFSDGLLSKHGVGDGDAPDEFFDYCDERGVDYEQLQGWHTVLCTLVRRYLLPALDQDVTTVRIGTSHNPIRARTVDGRKVEDEWYEDTSTKLTPEFVEVPMAEVLKVARYVRGEVVSDRPALPKPAATGEAG